MNTSESLTVKPQPVPLVKDNQTPSKVDKVSTAPVESKPDEKPAAAEKKAAPAQEIKKEISVPCPQQKAGTDAKATDTITPRKEPPKQNYTQPDPAKTQQQPSKDAANPVKSAPPAEVGHPKQESNFFGFGLGGPKAQPSSSKPSESTTGKLFGGFGGLTETARSRSPSPQSVSAVSGKFWALDPHYLARRLIWSPQLFKMSHPQHLQLHEKAPPFLLSLVNLPQHQLLAKPQWPLPRLHRQHLAKDLLQQNPTRYFLKKRTNHLLKRNQSSSMRPTYQGYLLQKRINLKLDRIN